MSSPSLHPFPVRLLSKNLNTRKLKKIVQQICKQHKSYFFFKESASFYRAAMCSDRNNVNELTEEGQGNQQEILMRDKNLYIQGFLENLTSLYSYHSASDFKMSQWDFFLLPPFL
ncbi:hypothetical protein AMECASPLE_013353 [Ameca splendens]|uniref:Uncharacterized protein n=1 Tax=Ameca splendens TaxID=208324 RepID=A0ABV0YC82_9TELE